MNVRTGRVETISEEYLESTDHSAERDDLPEWLRDEYVRSREISESSDYVDLPSQHEIHEYEIMRSFAEEHSDSVIRGTLLESLRGRGAFRDSRTRHSTQVQPMTGTYTEPKLLP